MTGSAISRRRVRRAALAAGALGLVLAASGCGSSGLDAGPLQASIARAFANLYVLQQTDQGNPRPALAALHSRASCLKGTPDSRQSGAGNDWTCQITFLVAGPATPVTAHYTVTVQTNGCYAADGDGPASVNGTRTLTASDGSQKVNPLWLIDGCFDLG